MEMTFEWAAAAFSWLFIAANREMMSLGARPDAILSPLSHPPCSFDGMRIEGDWEFETKIASLGASVLLLLC
jgi:hypothetical protein